MSRYDITNNRNNDYPPEHRRVERSSFNTGIIGSNNVSRTQSYATNWDNSGDVDDDITSNRKVNSKIEQDAVLFVRSVLSEAIVHNTSDVHFEPKRVVYKIRFRVDGILHHYVERDIEEYPAVLNAIKVLGGMHIAEHMVPQDGHIEMIQEEVDANYAMNTPQISGAQSNTQSEQITTKNPKPKQHYYDMRASVFPSVNGEAVVIRILNRESALLSTEDLGMDDESLKALNDMLMSSYGMLLITGPTGSGKTTTLYSILGELKSDEKNIITLEDPIEFHLDWLRQCEINAERGFSFEDAMASVLRQDPDILMVGEIRDPKTAEYAIKSALVGRIVGSTIHANTTIGTIARLIELGIQRSVLAHAINGIIAQRLVRKTCKYCLVEYEPPSAYLEHFGLSKDDGPFYKGKGCERCNGTGFSGRIGLFSLMLFNDDIRNLLFEKRPLVEIQEYAIKSGMKTLKMDAIGKIKTGLITIEEALRVI